MATMIAWMTTGLTVQRFHPGAAPGIVIEQCDNDDPDLRGGGRHVAESRNDLPASWGVDDHGVLVEDQVDEELRWLGFARTGGWRWSRRFNCWTCEVRRRR